MLVSLTVNWAYATTPPSPFPVTVYWREKGSTGAYNIQPVATGTSITITTISDSASTLNSACTLEYEGYVIPNCFIDGPKDCFAIQDDLVSPNPDCPDGERSRWSASVPALSYQACRGVKVTCESSGVLSAHILDPNGTLKFATWDIDNNFFPDTVVTDQNTGGGFDAVVTVGSLGQILNPQCLVLSTGSGYTLAPIAHLEPSEQGETYQLQLTMGCREFDYQDCQTNGQDSGHILLNDFRTICMPADEFDGFDPQATNAVFSKEQIGCCSGNGRYYRLTFGPNPDPTWYSNVSFAYGLPNSTNPGEQWSEVRSLSNSVPFEVCAVEGSLVSYGPEPGGLVCKTDYQTNAYLFENHVDIQDLGPC